MKRKEEKERMFGDEKVLQMNEVFVRVEYEYLMVVLLNELIR